MTAQLWKTRYADAAIGTVATLVMLVAASQSGDTSPHSSPTAMVVGVIGIGVWSGLARRWPRVSLVSAPLCALLAFATAVPGFSPGLALAVPFFAAGRAGRLGWGSAVLGVFTAIEVSYRLFVDPGDPGVGLVMLNAFQDGALLVVVLLLGETLRTRLALRQDADLRLQVAEREYQRRMTEQRLRTAQDLHDVLAHTVTVVSIQAGVAAQTLDASPARAREALDLVTAASRDAMADLRGTIEVLRQEVPAQVGAGPAPGVEQIGELLDGTRSAGLQPTLTVHGEPVALRPAIALAVYRVVQESVTNVLRHAHAANVSVDVEYRADGVYVHVRDDGRGPGAEQGGFGLRGMRERVAALGGELTSGAATDDGPGFVVRARLPTEGSR